MEVQDFNKMLECANQILAAAECMEQAGIELERRLVEARQQQNRWPFFQKPLDDLDKLAKQRQQLVRHMRNQGLYIKECVRRYRAAQSRAVIRASRTIQ